MGGPMAEPKAMSVAQRAYEEKQAKKAGKTLDAWLKGKQKRAAESDRAAAPPAPVKKPGLIARLLDRAHKPL